MMGRLLRGKLESVEPDCLVQQIFDLVAALDGELDNAFEMLDMKL